MSSPPLSRIPNLPLAYPSLVPTAVGFIVVLLVQARTPPLLCVCHRFPSIRNFQNPLDFSIFIHPSSFLFCSFLSLPYPISFFSPFRTFSHFPISPTFYDTDPLPFYPLLVLTLPLPPPRRRRTFLLSTVRFPTRSILIPSSEP